jgi:regulator of sigma E protease
MLGRILIGEASLKNISGPITMADFAGQSAQAERSSSSAISRSSASVSACSICFPFRYWMGAFAVLFRRNRQRQSVSDRAFEVGQRIGMAMLAVLMALALFNDLSRLF